MNEFITAVRWSPSSCFAVAHIDFLGSSYHPVLPVNHILWTRVLMTSSHISYALICSGVSEESQSASGCISETKPLPTNIILIWTAFNLFTVFFFFLSQWRIVSGAVSYYTGRKMIWGHQGNKLNILDKVWSKIKLVIFFFCKFSSIYTFYINEVKIGNKILNS